MRTKRLQFRANACFLGLLVGLLALSGHPASAQTVNGAFHGTVTDTSGAVIPGATVTVTNLATNLVRQVSADASGFYTITQLPPGHYAVTVSRPGFATVRQADVDLQVNQDLEADYTLKVGAVTQQVQVTAAPSALETTSSTIGQVIASKQVVDLPLNGRQFTQMILLTPGAVPREGGQQSAFIIPIGGGGISPDVNGQRGRQNNFTLDGALNNNLMDDTYGISPPPDAIEEFKVQSHITDAQVGMSPGANVNVVTKTGSAQIHGDAWEFLRNDKLDAANFFDNVASTQKPPFRMNQFGFTLGGPVMLPGYDGRKKKTYFFGYYEGFRSSQGFTLFNNVPTSQELGGNFSDLLTKQQTVDSSGKPIFDPLGRPVVQGQIYNPYSTRQVTAGAADPVTGLVAQSTGLVRDPFPGNIVPTSMLNPQALAYIHAFYPLPNFGPGGNSFPNLAVASNEVISDDQFGVKIDHTFGNNDTLFGGFYLTNPNAVQPNSLLLGTSTQLNDARVISVGYTHLFSPTLLLTLHYGYQYTNFFTGNTPAGLALSESTNQLGFEPVKNGVPLVPAISLSPRLGGTGQFSIPLGPGRSQIINADVQKISGPHTLSAGVMYYHIHSFDDGWGMNQSFDQFPTSAIIGPGANQSQTGDGLASALLNLPSNLSGFLGQTAANTTDLWQGYYVQDKWQASRKLNLHFGLRYDYVPPLHWANDRTSGFSNQCGCFLISQPFGTQFPFANVRATYFDPQYNGFQPRFGLAYRLPKDTVIRGGFAMFDDHSNNLVQETQDLRIPWPWGVDPNIVDLNRGIPNTFFSSPPGATTFFPSPQTASHPFIFSGANNQNKMPVVSEWNFGVEHQFTPNTTMDVTYVGSNSYHLQTGYTDNTVLPNQMGPGLFVGTNRTPYPAFGLFGYDTNLGTSNYNALETKVEKRFSEGLTFLGSYTWSHCLDLQSGPYTQASFQDPYNISADYGSCGFDITHVFVFSSVYQLPFGRGMHFGSRSSRVTNGVLGGWQLSGIVSAQSGSPFTVMAGFDNSNTGVGNDRANLVGNPLPPGFVQNRFHWDNPAAFVVSPPYTYGNSGRDILRGPGYTNLDFSLMKDFKFTESKYLEFRADAFNIFNNVNFSNPETGSTPGYANQAGASSTSVTSPTFMQILAAGPAREIQFALKFVW
ncbi:MAG TPA: TonB-dependent receptor [Terriglobia bacterium]|nr:TonB-dependent receptor [Terriglobia bacterium]